MHQQKYSIPLFYIILYWYFNCGCAIVGTLHANSFQFKEFTLFQKIKIYRYQIWLCSTCLLNPQKCSLGIVCIATIASYLEIQHYGNSNNTNNGTWQIQLQFAPLKCSL